jgi:hypothetical protein
LLADSPNDAEALTWRATLAFEDEDLPVARWAAARAAELAPFDPKPAFVLARVLTEQLAELQLEATGRASLAEDDTERTAAAAAQRALAEHSQLLEATRARFALLAAVDSRTRNLEATLALDVRDVATRVELARLRASIGDERGALRQAAALARGAPERADAQIVVLEVLAAHGRRASVDAHARLLEERFGSVNPAGVDAHGQPRAVPLRDVIAVLEALERFHAQRGDVQARLRTGARAAELRQGK